MRKPHSPPAARRGKNQTTPGPAGASTLTRRGQPRGNPALPRSKYQIFPAHPPDRRAALEAWNTHHGIGIEDATVWDDQGNVIDGWERESICAKKGITCPRVVQHFDSEADKFRFVLTANAFRRPNLNQQQKREVIAAYLRGDPAVADNMLGAALGVSKNTVLAVRQRLEASGGIRKVHKTRGQDGKLRPVRYTKRIITNSPSEFEKAQAIVGDLPESCAGKTLDLITATRRARRHQQKNERQGPIIPPLPSDAVRLYHCRFQALEQVAALQPASAQLVIADIPYERGFLPQVDDLGQLAQRVLGDGGVLVLYDGQAYLNRVVASLDKYLTYRWTAAFVWGGDANVFHPLGVVSQWKPLLIYSKGPWRRRGRWPDVIRATGKEKEWHPWQQPADELARLVSYFSQPGELVVDPCGGGFTTAEQCLWLARRCVSCDADAACVGKGLERLEQARKKMALGE